MNTLFLCEFKFSRNEIKSSVIKEMEKKCSALQLPRGCGMAPVLFHINGACPSLEKSSFFYKVIDLREYLEKEL